TTGHDSFASLALPARRTGSLVHVRKCRRPAILGAHQPESPHAQRRTALPGPSPVRPAGAPGAVENRAAERCRAAAAGTQGKIKKGRNIAAFFSLTKTYATPPAPRTSLTPRPTGSYDRQVRRSHRPPHR